MKIFLLFFILALPLGAQLLGKDEITARIEANKAKATGEETDPATVADREEAAKIWAEALAQLEAAADSRKLESKIRNDLKKLDQLVELKIPAKLPPGASRSEQEALLERIEVLRNENEAQVEKITQSPEPGESLTAQEEMLKDELDQLDIPAAATGELGAARYQKAVQTKDRLQAKLAEISAKKELNDKKAKLFDERIAAANKFEADLESLRAEVEKRIGALKKAEAADTRQAIEKLRVAFEGVPELAGIVGELEEIRMHQDKVEKRLADAKAYDVRMQDIGQTIEKQFKSAGDRIALLEEAKLGIDDETGMLLREQRARLPSVDEISSELREKLEVVAKTEIALLDLKDRVKNLPVLMEGEIAEVLRNNPEISRERIEELVGMRREALTKLSEENRALKEELAKGITAARQAITDVEIYSNFIDERLLWIKSAKPFSWSEPVAEWERLLDLVSVETLMTLANSIRSNFFGKIAKVLLVVIAVVVILLRRRKLGNILGLASEKAARRNCTSLKPTLKYLGAAFLLSVWLPLIFWILSDLTQEPNAWKAGLYRLAVFFFLSSLFLKFARPNGLFICHFRINPERAGLFHRNLKWLTPIAPFFVFLVPALNLTGDDPSAGRLAFIVAMLLLAGFCHHLFQPNRSILQRESESNGFTKSCYFIIMLCPVVFIVGAILGYFESVLTLRDQVGATAILLVLAFLVMRFLTRWTLVSRRDLAIKQALRRREVALAEREQEGDEVERENQQPNLEEVKAEAVNVVEVEEQTTKLLKIAVYSAAVFGLWGIWQSTLPALSVLDKVELWNSGSATTSSSSSPATLPGLPGGSGESSGLTPDLIPEDDGKVTLQDLLFTVIFFVLTFVASSNIPGVLSLTLFNRIKLGPGGNFALTTTVRYIIVFTGVIVALGQIGITWGKVQWLAAAVSLGIGFGLQEIFANFVAGIILLFERPIRLGDIVTVGDISGSVTQIRIRATTIRQFNNRELLVPNKEFITSQLVNWTLNDSILRLEIQVGIAYGSDTKKATKILEKLLSDHPHTMDDPGPAVFFMGFGNSTLDFEARAFVPSAEFLLSTKSELHYQIDEAFREAGIEIAFPQQDVHLRSIPQGMKLSE